MALTQQILDELVIALRAMNGPAVDLAAMEAWGKRAPTLELRKSIYSAFELAGADAWLLGRSDTS